MEVTDGSTAATMSGIRSQSLLAVVAVVADPAGDADALAADEADGAAVPLADGDESVSFAQPLTATIRTRTSVARASDR